MGNCNKETILNKINEYREYTGISKSALASTIGVEQTTLNNQLIGKRGLSLDTIIALLDTYPALSSEWLLRGEGEMLISNQPQPNSAELDRIDKLTGAIESLQEVIKSKSDIITAQQERIQQLENQLKNR